MFNYSGLSSWSLAIALYIFGFCVWSNGWGQEPAAARAIVSCGSEEDPDRLELALTGLFGRDDTNVFNLACDHAEIFGVATIQELVTVLAISGPQAQVQAEATVAVQISPIPNCPIGGTAAGFGYTAAGSVIELSVAIETKQPPPISLGTLPGIAIISGSVSVDIDSPSETMDGEQNRGLAAIGFLDGTGQSLGTWQVEINEGNEFMNVADAISLDMITTGEDMVFSKGAVVEVELFALEPCEGGESEVSALAVMDPIFEFDQARFDAEQGSNSFDLSEYFAIKMSPNLNVLLFEDGFESEP